MKELIKQITSLSNEYPNNVKVYSPCNFLKQYIRCEGKFPYRLDENYKELLLFSNGLSILDYCVFGCKNRKIADIVDESFGLWSVRPDIPPQFIPFMSSMGGEIFGFHIERKINSSSQQYPVAILEEDNYDEGYKVIFSSFYEFLDIFIKEAKNTLENSKNKDEILFTLDNEFWK